MKNQKLLFVLLLLVTTLTFAACIKMDFFMFASEPASMDDYDFTQDHLDGIPLDRITSELISSANPNEKIHVIYVERDVEELDPRLNPDDNITVIFSHGQSENNLYYWYRVGYFEDMGFNVLLYDYRGYGASDGEATETHVYQDAETVYDYLRAKDDVGEIFSVGYSMGGAPAIWLCSPSSSREVTGCFTESAFASTDQLIDEGSSYDFEASWFLDVMFDNESMIQDVNIPFLLMHGTLDQTVSFTNAELLWRQVQDNNPANTFYIIEGASHRNVPVPSYQGTEEPREFSHPDEFPAYLEEDFALYKSRIVNFVVDTMNAS